MVTLHPMRVTRLWSPLGDAGTEVTVSQVVNLIRRGSVHPKVRAWAAHLVAGVAPRDTPTQLRYLRSWLVAHWRFLRDPYGAELLHSADVLLTEYERQGYIQADCDDAAILSGALARSIGFRTRLQTVGFRPTGPYQHIWLEAWSPLENKWVEMDVTRTSQDLESHIGRQFITPV